MRAALVLIVVGGLGTLSSGCWTSVARGDEHERRLRDLELGTAKQSSELTEQLTIAKRRVAELEKVLEQATQVVTRNSADLGLEVKGLRDQIGRLEGELAEVRNQNTQLSATLGSRLDQFARKAGVDVAIDPAAVPADKNEHYLQAYRAYSNSDHSTARGLFREYVKRYPTDAKAAEAQYYIGKSYLAQQRPANALGEFRTVLQTYANSAFADDALYDMAQAFWDLAACGDATTALNAFVQKYTSSPLIKTAKSKQREWKKPAAGYCKE